jgi:hypothetical protein
MDMSASRLIEPDAQRGAVLRSGAPLAVRPEMEDR